MDCEHASSVTQQLLLQSPNQPVPQPHQQRNVHRTATPPKPKKSVFEASLAKIKASSSAPNLSGKSGSTHFGSRLSSFTQGSGRDVKPEKRKQTGKTMPTVAGAQKRRSKSSGLGKLSEPGSASHDQAKDSNFTPDKPSPSDSSSENSDCTSEENKLSTTSSDTECRSRCEADEGEGREDLGSLVPDRNVKGHQRAKTPVDRDLTPVPLGQERGEESLSPSDERSFVSTDSRLNFRASFTFSDLQEEFMNSMHDEFIREMEELRSENEYLKDELEELQAEMLEMRDEYLQEDVLQLQALRQQLEQANKSCRILQYRLRKAERRSLRMAQTGGAEGELIRTLEQDLTVAKDVSVRLHRELEAVERRRAGLEQENAELRERLQELEVSRQVLQAEMDKSRENSLKRRGSRSSCKPEKKLSPQEDSAELRCQLHFAKEESALMCRKLAKMARENEAMAEELSRFRSLYGGTAEGPASEHTHAHAREAEVRVHLRLVEEEATLLSRRIAELEVENRGLRAEMEEMRYPELPEGAPLPEGEAGKGAELLQKNMVAAEELTETSVGVGVGLNLCVANGVTPQGDASPLGSEGHALLSHLDLGAESHKRGGALSLGPGHYPALLNIRDQARLLSSAIHLLTTSVHAHRPAPVCHMTPPITQDQGVVGKDTLSHSLMELQAQLLAFVRRVEALEVSCGEEAPPTLPNAHPTRLTTDAQETENSSQPKQPNNRNQSEQQVKGQAEETDGPGCNGMVSQEAEETDTEEDEGGCWGGRLWQDVPLQTLLQHKMRSQDAQLQPVQLRQSLLLLSLQLRSFLKHWHHGNGLELEEGGRDFLEGSCVKRLCLLMEEGGLDTPPAGEDPLPPETHKHHSQQGTPMEFGGVCSTLSELKGVLQELTAEMLEERQASRDLAQKFARAKTAWDAERSELLRQITQSLCEEVPEKDKERNTGRETQANGADLQSSELQAPPRVLPRAQGPRRYQERGDPYGTWGGPTRTGSLAGLSAGCGAEVQRSHTAPERTGLRIYFSPPVARRGNRGGEGQVGTRALTVTHGNNVHSLAPGKVAHSNAHCGWPQVLPVMEDGGVMVATNLSDDMKEMTRERGRADAACQTVALATNTVGVTSVALQTEEEGLEEENHAHLCGLPRRQISASLERMVPRPGRPLKLGSPKLQRRISTPSSLPFSSTSSSSSSSALSSSSLSSTSSSTSSFSSCRLEGPVGGASPWRVRGQNGSAWTRSMVPRAGPPVSRRSSGLFGVVDRGVARGIEPARSDGGGSAGAPHKHASGVGGGKPAAAGGVHRYGIVQEFLRSVCGRGQGPIGGAGAGGRGRTGGGVQAGKPERPTPRPSATAGSDSITTGSETVPRILNKRLQRGEEPARVGGVKSRGNKSVEDAACECTSRSLTSCFARPSRSSSRHAPGQCRLRPRDQCQTSERKGQLASE